MENQVETSKNEDPFVRVPTAPMACRRAFEAKARRRKRLKEEFEDRRREIYERIVDKICSEISCGHTYAIIYKSTISFDDLKLVCADIEEKMRGMGYDVYGSEEDIEIRWDCEEK